MFLYTSILFGLVYRKDENYHPKVFSEKFQKKNIYNCFWKSIKSFGISSFGSAS